MPRKLHPTITYVARVSTRVPKNARSNGFVAKRAESDRQTRREGGKRSKWRMRKTKVGRTDGRRYPSTITLREETMIKEKRRKEEEGGQEERRGDGGELGLRIERERREGGGERKRKIGLAGRDRERKTEGRRRGKR